MQKKSQSHLAENRLSASEFDTIAAYEAGIVLTGPEVKAAKTGRLNLRGSSVTIRQGEPWLVQTAIGPYPPASRQNPPLRRPRKLLLNRNEIKQIIGFVSAKGLTAVPTAVYNKQGIIKIKFAVVKRKKIFDRREAIKKREFQRQRQKILR